MQINQYTTVMPHDWYKANLNNAMKLSLINYNPSVQRYTVEGDYQAMSLCVSIEKKGDDKINPVDVSPFIDELNLFNDKYRPYMNMNVMTPILIIKLLSQVGSKGFCNDNRELMSERQTPIVPKIIAKKKDVIFRWICVAYFYIKHDIVEQLSKEKLFAQEGSYPNFIIKK